MRGRQLTQTQASARRRLPRWLSGLLGLLCILVGAFLVLKPFSSLAMLVLVIVVGLVLTGLGELSDDDPPGGRRLAVARGVVYLLAAVVVLVWPGATIRVLSVVVGIALVVGGVLDVVGARRLSGTTRWNALVSGIASVVFGLLALAWPDVTTLVIAVVFGAKVVILGVRLLVDAVRRTRKGDLEAALAHDESPKGGWWRLLGSVGALAAALVLILVSLTFQRGVPTADAFYDAPQSVPAQPGKLLKSEPFTRKIPDGAMTWRILYTTTRDEGQPAVASALVVAPKAAATTPSPVIAWAHGTTGAVPGCAPTVLDDPFETGAMFIEDKVIQKGWVMVATDYVGLGTEGPHPYLIGQGEGRSVLDAMRAARQLSGVRLTDQNVVWGHSQGGGAALWTGVLAPTYAPELKIAGVAALAPASNLIGLVENLHNVKGGSLFAAYVIDAYSRIYPDVRFDDYVRPGARTVIREMATRCLSEPGVMVSVISSLLVGPQIWSQDPGTGPLGKRLQDNTPPAKIQAPLLLGQGAADSLVVPTAQAAYVKSLCAAGQQVDYRTYAGRDHVPLVQADSPLAPELLDWTDQRLAGAAPKNTCP
ncbi:hypothetical protein N865_07315 [Intrasporangium oryzae NRRL B-24470]|uniref:Lipase n=1 Tax=Intrasporangium oryzae NRRL B-24470 TaxID=1386089 RepID=W9G7E9_9MICO|nr:lipase family protein [Intrasporangium oryzae]EWT02086.1 hypothetical protein N865_07315 [Intrasporangium oryzae NRRL B-24470]